EAAHFGGPTIVVTDAKDAVPEVQVQRFRIALLLDHVEKDVRGAPGPVLRVNHAGPDHARLFRIDKNKQVLALERVEPARKRFLRLGDQALERVPIVGQVDRVEVLCNLVNLVEIFGGGVTDHEHEPQTYSTRDDEAAS